MRPLTHLLHDCWPLLLLGGGAMLDASRPYWRQRALRRHGQPATATVVAVSAGPEGGDMLHLRFTTRDGVVVDWPNATQVIVNQHVVGDPLPVRYLPRHPRRCLLLADVYSNAPREILWFYAGFGLLCLVSDFLP